MKTLAYQTTKTTTEQQDEQFVFVVSRLTRKELQNLVAGSMSRGATNDAMRAYVAKAVASGRYLVLER